LLRTSVLYKQFIPSSVLEHPDEICLQNRNKNVMMTMKSKCTLVMVRIKTCTHYADVRCSFIIIQKCSQKYSIHRS